MDATRRCPDPAKLQAYAAGQLAADELEAIAAHLDACPVCQTLLAALPPERDTFTVLVRQVGQVAPFAETECRRAAALLATVSPTPEAQPGEVTQETPTGALLPTSSGNAAVAPTAEPPRQLREYLLLDKLGEGGMGAVYRAVHTRLDKVVALKVLPARSLNDPAAVARFQREMKAVGKLDHPNIVRATDAGEVDGTHFLVMEFAAGANLTEVVKAHGRLAVADACELIRQAAVGLEHAHANGLVHRDVKPSNLLLTATGQVKVLDLGLALLQGHQPVGPDATSSGLVMGTFDYIAPEQGDDAHAVDGRADLYSLGCTLYHLLTGRPPFHGAGPATPLQKLRAHALTPVPPIRARRADVPPALAAVLDRLLAKDPADRFARAADVAAALAPLTAGADLPRLLAPQASSGGEGDPPLLQTVSVPRPTQPLARRRRRLAVAAAVLAACVGIAVLRIQTDRGVLEIETLDDQVKVIVEQRGEQVTVVDLAANQQIRLKSGRYQLKLGEGGADLELDLTDVTLERAGKAVVHIRRRAAPAVALLKLPEGPPGEVGRLDGHTGQVNCVAVTRDGRTAVSGGLDNTVRVWDVASGRGLRRCEGFTENVWAVALSPDGKYVLAAGGDVTKPDGNWAAGTDFTLHLCELASGREVRRFTGHTKGVRGVAFSPDGRRAVSGGIDGTLRFWDVATGRPLHVGTGHEYSIWAVAFSASGRWVATAGYDHTVRLWKAETGAAIRTYGDPGHTAPVLSVAISPDERYLLSGGLDQTLRLWERDTGREVGQFPRLPTGVLHVAFSPDGRYALSASGSVLKSPDRYVPAGRDNLARLWDVATGQELYRCAGHTNTLTTAVFTPDGTHALSAGSDTTLRLWRLPDPATAVPLTPIYVPDGAPRVVSLVDGDVADFRAWLERMRRTGYRPTFVDTHLAQGQPRFLAIAVKDGRNIPWEATVGLTVGENQKAFDDLAARGYAVLSVAGYTLAGTARYVSLYARDPHRLWLSLPARGVEGYERRLREIQQAKLRLVELKALQLGVDPYFNLVAESDDGKPWKARIGLTFEQVTLYLNAHANEGLLPISMSAYPDGDQTRFAVVLRRPDFPAGCLVRSELVRDEFLREQDRMTARGLRPLVLAGYPSGKAVRYLGVWVQDALADPPLAQTGEPVPEVGAFDQVMQHFLRGGKVPAGTLAVVKDGRLVLSRGYGYADRDGQQPVEPDAPLRLASLVKPMTAATVRQLVRDGKLTLDTRVQTLLALEPPPGKRLDPRWRDVTVRHLLDHQGGWDRAATFDPMTRPGVIAQALGKEGPATTADILRFMAGEPLQFDPGSKSVYSNFGYCLLGRVIEKVTGRSYLDAVRQEVLAPLGINSVALARTRVADRAPREPHYSVPGEADGTPDVEVMDAHGGLIAAAPDLARFFAAYDFHGRPVRGAGSAGDMGGRMPGTFTLALRQPDGTVIVALFNQLPDATGWDYARLREELSRAGAEVRRWPGAEAKRP